MAEYLYCIYTIILHKSVSLSVGVRKRQVAILARSSREMSLTDRILPRYILSRIRVSVRPSNFLNAKNINKLPQKPNFPYLTVELTSGATGHNTLSDVNVEWPATRLCINTTAVIAYLAGQIDRNNENQPVETATIRVYTFTA